MASISRLMVPEALRQPACLRRFESFVERAFTVGDEMVFDEDDVLCVRNILSLIPRNASV